VLKRCFLYGFNGRDGYNLWKISLSNGIKRTGMTIIMTQAKVLYTALALLLLASMNAVAIEQPQAQAFAGQDLHLRGVELISHQPTPNKNILIFEGNFSMSIGANTFSSNSAVVWLQTITSEYQGRSGIEYYAQVYMEGDVDVKRGEAAKTTDIATTVMENGHSLVARFDVSGDVFATADKRKVSDPNNLDIYKRAAAALVPAKYEPFVNPEADVPSEKKYKPSIIAATPPQPHEAAPGKPTRKPSLIEEFFMPTTSAAKPAAEEKKPEFRYPVNIQSATDAKLKIEADIVTPDGISAATVIGRFYVWQKLDERGGLLELQADNAVIFYRGEELSLDRKETQKDNILASGPIKAIYLSGNVVMSESTRTIRGDELFYDFDKHAGIAVNAEMRSFDEGRNVPIYVRASKLRQLSQTKFEGSDVVLTTSEFYVPQFSFDASSIVITDNTTIAGQLEKMGDSAYMAELKDVRFKLGQTTLMKWPRMETNLSAPAVPLKSMHAGYDNTFGLGVETQWYLSRLLGLRQPEGTDSTLLLDYYGKRGAGGGVNLDYEREKYFGKMQSYIMDDHGEDDLGRINGRENEHPPEELRGRFSAVHRQFLPYNWQLTLGLSYLSDRNFLEEFDRQEFNTVPQETYIHLKRIQDNWGLSLLAKWRINNFQDELEELPSVEYHRTGESVFDNKFTFYSDTQLANFRQRIGNDEPINISQENYTFATTRNELDLPLTLGTWKFVPYTAGTVGYDDRSGFQSSLVDQAQPTGSPGDYTTGIGEVGLRFSTQYWTVYPDAQSRLFDVNELRHLVKPYFAGAAYSATDDVMEDEQHNVINVGTLQRWQTRRGPKQEAVDWMRLDTSFTFVDNEANSTSGPNLFVWNKPLVPLRVLSAPGIFNGDLSASPTDNPTLARFEQWGPQRNTFNSDYVWRVTDTLAVLSDGVYDLKNGTVDQFDVGYSHLVYPHLSYYLGSRYLRNTQVLDEHGTNAVTAAITYIIDPRYTITFAQQYDFDYEASLRSELTLLRQYHRIYYGLSFSADESLDRQTIMFSIWPQGVPELAVGSRRYMGITGQSGNE
jgi:hypothetical protein